jgi:hypothetical protein
MPPKLSETGKKIRRFKWLADDLAIANTSFYIYRNLLDAEKHGFRNEMQKSKEFWGYTQRAHCIVSLIYLCRVFDTYRNRIRKADDAFHLLRLVEEIDESKLSGQQNDQRRKDVNYLQREDWKLNKFPDPKVARLRKWRNNLLSHSNEELILKGLNDFIASNPLADSEIQQLIDDGFTILERWAPFYKASIPIKRLARSRDDYLCVLQTLRLGHGGSGGCGQ